MISVVVLLLSFCAILLGFSLHKKTGKSKKSLLLVGMGMLTALAYAAAFVLVAVDIIRFPLA